MSKTAGEPGSFEPILYKTVKFVMFDLTRSHNVLDNWATKNDDVNQCADMSLLQLVITPAMELLQTIYLSSYVKS